MLQATASGYETIDEESVYACTGNPRPADMRELLTTLFKRPFDDGCAGEALTRLVRCATTISCDLEASIRSPHAAVAAFAAKGYALTDMLTELNRLLSATGVRPEIRIMLLDRLCDIEYRLAFGTSDKLQGAALVAAFQHARTRMTELKRADAAAAAGAGAAGAR